MHFVVPNWPSPARRNGLARPGPTLSVPEHTPYVMIHNLDTDLSFILSKSMNNPSRMHIWLNYISSRVFFWWKKNNVCIVLVGICVRSLNILVPAGEMKSDGMAQIQSIPLSVATTSRHYFQCKGCQTNTDPKYE